MAAEDVIGGTGMAASTRVLAVVLNWNRSDLSLRAARHALQQRGAAPDVVVIDNGSSDGSVDRLRASGLDLQVLGLAANQGFASGMNVGMAQALAGGYEYVWLINNDAFVGPDCLRTLVDRLASDEQLAVVTPRLLSVDGSEQHAGGTVNLTTAQVATLSAADLEAPRGPGFWLTGTVLLLRTSMLRRVGLFEPQFFAYWEDVDLCSRLTASGATIAAVPAAVATHLGSASSGGLDSPLSTYLMTRNAWLFLLRNTSPSSRWAQWLRYSSEMLEKAASHDLCLASSAVQQAVVSGVSAARWRRVGRPPAILRPAPLERMLFRHPWRATRMLRTAAGWLEPAVPVGASS